MKRRNFLAVATAGVATPSLLAQKTVTTNTPPFVVKAGDARFGVHTPYKGINPNDLKISGKDTNGQLAVFEYIGNDKVGPSLHVHHDQDEIFSIIEGKFLFQVGDKQFTANAGDTVFGPRNVPHTWIQLSEKSKIIYYVQPAGKMEEFFLSMNELKAPPTKEQAEEIHKAHGMTVLGPGLTIK
ncbi:cupin domain-containing protein [Runella aurantiaca]|uniref:Cupin domain-containing protein n=1 Tax=Runella aurantiaca TaxID=2282308 RepID=A0A369ICI2_9BACT|nr:cupin domain-containing protein [Runella aurantiaca]RDB05975.1 cupin domain-containing protein [Runella aurantiaca]